MTARPKGVYDVRMIRTNHHLTRQQVQALQALAKKTGLSVAELVRRAIDLYLAQQGK